MLISQLICLFVCVSVQLSVPFYQEEFTTNKTGISFLYFVSFLWNTTLEKKNLNRKNNATETENTTKKKKNWNNLVIPHTTQNSKELGRSHILQAHVKVQRCIYRFKNVYVKIICACVYASVEVTKGLFPQAFVLFILLIWFLVWRRNNTNMRKRKWCEKLEIIC